MFRTVILTGALLLLAGEAALAQTRLPRVSPSEQHVEDINRSIQRQQRGVATQQQQQFEVNQLRQELNRRQAVPSITGTGGIGRICPPGRIVC